MQRERLESPLVDEQIDLAHERLLVLFVAPESAWEHSCQRGAAKCRHGSGRRGKLEKRR